MPPPYFCVHCRLQNPYMASHCLRCDKKLFSGKEEGACPGCGTRNRAGRMRCSSCGQRLSGDLDATTRIEVSRVRARARSQTKGGPPPESEEVLLKPPLVKTVFTEEEGERAVGWLCCDPFEPLPLGAKQKVVLGRGDDCDMVLPHDTVSRHHAIIRYVEGDLLLQDCSTYGTFLNGERVKTRHIPIKAGDQLKLGTYKLEVRDRAQGEQTKTKGRTTRPFHTLSGSGELLRGRPDQMVAVLQQIELRRDSGTMRMVVPDKSGLIVIYEGRPMHAEFAGAVGVKALAAMAVQEKGFFSFTSNVERVDMSLNMTMTQFILEAIRLQDESGLGRIP